MKLKLFISHHLVAIFIILVSIIFATQAIALEYAATLVAPTQTNTSERVILSKIDIDDKNLKLNQLNDLLVDLVSAYEESISISIYDLETAESIMINPEQTYKMASLYKLFVAEDIYRQANLGKIDLNLPVSTSVGSIEIEECLRLSIVYSSNECGRALRSRIGADIETPEAIKQKYTSTDTSGDYPTSNIEDVTQLLINIYSQPNPLNKNLVNHLLNQEKTTKLPSAIERGEIANKTGELEDVSHDAGILYDPLGDKIIVVMSSKWENPFNDSPALFRDVLRIYYSVFESS